MPNNLDSNPWILNSTGVVTALPVRPARIRVDGSCTLHDKNGAVMFVSAADEDTAWDEASTRFWDGLTVNAISGTVYFHYA